jgi:two-component system nitrate/nitrite response regulator NarL
MSEIRVVVADDHPLFRRGVVDSIAAEEDLNVVGEASTGEDATRLVADLLPDVLLLDIDMPGQGGIATAADVSSRFPATQILILTVSESEDDLLGALKAGARGYVLKGVAAHGLSHAIRAIVAGEVYISPSLAGTILYEMTRNPEVDPLSELTEREHEVLQLVGEGLTNREIGERLFLAEKTVKHYMTAVLQKLHVRTRVEAALLAQRQQQQQSD